MEANNLLQYIHDYGFTIVFATVGIFLAYRIGMAAVEVFRKRMEKKLEMEEKSHSQSLRESENKNALVMEQGQKNIVALSEISNSTKMIYERIVEDDIALTKISELLDRNLSSTNKIWEKHDIIRGKVDNVDINVNRVLTLVDIILRILNKTELSNEQLVEIVSQLVSQAGGNTSLEKKEERK